MTHPAQVSPGGTFTVCSFEGRRGITLAAQPGTAQTQLNVSALAAGNYLLMYQAGPSAQRLAIKFLKPE